MTCRVTLLLVAPMVMVAHHDLQAGPFTDIVAFGDSMTDTGNGSLAGDGRYPVSPHYYEGRASNGPVWVEYLADRLGVQRPEASLGGGTNYAYSGAQTGWGIQPPEPDGPAVLRLGTQIEQFFADGRPISEDTLFVIWAGFNDDDLPRSDAEIVANLSDHVQTLYARGGRNFVLANLNNSWPRLNRLWWQEIDRLETQFDIDVARLDFVQFLNDVIADPAAFGFTHLAERALSSRGRVAPDPETYVLWDQWAHLTTTAHRFVGDRAFDAVVTSIIPKFTLFDEGDSWKFFRGREPPSGPDELAWTTTVFDDADWPTGQEPFGFGSRLPKEVATPLDDMPGNYTSAYFRRSFHVAEPDGVFALVLKANFDDNIIAYINGVEVARSDGTDGAIQPFDAPLGASHSARQQETYVIDLAIFPSLLSHNGDNVLAIQGVDSIAESTDFYFGNVELLAAVPEPSTCCLVLMGILALLARARRRRG